MLKFYLGVDVSKKKLDLCLRHNGADLDVQCVSNSQKAISAYLRTMLKKFDIPIDKVVICAEHTGQYTYPLICVSKLFQMVLWLEDATKIKYSQGLSRGKNDKVDAHRIAVYAERYGDCVKPYAMSSEEIERLKQYASERSLMLSDRAKYTSQLTDQKEFMHKMIFESKAARLMVVINALNKAIAEIDDLIMLTIKDSKLLNRQMELLTSIDGIGEKTALKMIIATEAFTSFDNARKFCCHAGVAPFAYTSGSSQRSKNKVSHRADKSIKTLLHLSALTICNMKGHFLYKYYVRKVAEGKNKMSVINAMRAKLVIIMFAVIKNDTLFSRNFRNSLA